MSEQLDEIERQIMTSYRLMKDYRELDEPDMVEFHEGRMNGALVQWTDESKYLARMAVAEAISPLSD